MTDSLEICRTTRFLICAVLNELGGTQIDQVAVQPIWAGVGGSTV